MRTQIISDILAVKGRLLLFGVNRLCCAWRFAFSGAFRQFFRWHLPAFFGVAAFGDKNRALQMVQEAEARGLLGEQVESLGRNVGAAHFQKACFLQGPAEMDT